MNKLKFTIILLLVATVTFAQKSLKSPRKQANGKIGEVTIQVDYGAPSVRERTIWADLVKYDKVWRAGANKNTTISFDKEVKIKKSTLPAGTYGFFIIPSENDKWEIIFSKKNDAWGSKDYDKKNDQLRLKIKVKLVEKNKEMLTFKVNEKGIRFSWEKARFLIPII